ncbi:DUF4242 domain-containing protein [Pseudodonghicola flavimaris]|uniref:DUF4242 domain-containing protein n=1 Tax=Pseudodonghicola flavimaris TaxID=3050036 RepID=A0ABT7EX04_9RHOB|nr:DUF4242 domain-containing protein [Pseudodonghicola flavimaris]MDK3016882.1 DUF4242 domain-containing protein [Pseudodonghicola flavimaris]
MPRFLIERQFAEQLQISDDAKLHIKEINDDEGIEWIFSFLSADKRKTYCLYEAPDEDAIRRAAKRLNIPADVITPVDRVDPGIFA